MEARRTGGSETTPLRALFPAAAHIASGAETPMRARPLAMTWRTAADRARRALVSAGSSVRTFVLL